MTINDFAKEYFHLEPVSFRTKDQNKLQKQRENFGGTCPICKQQMTYVPGTNVLVCKNAKCRGKERTVTTADGETKKVSAPSIKLLNEESTKIALNIFEE